MYESAMCPREYNEKVDIRKQEGHFRLLLFFCQRMTFMC